jgi:hypothetical protein
MHFINQRIVFAAPNRYIPAMTHLRTTTTTRTTRHVRARLVAA